MHAAKRQARALILCVLASTSSAETFREDFSEGLTPERWKVSTWTAPRSSPTHIARFSAAHVEVKDGLLRLKLTQTRNQDGTISSTGSELMSTQKFGYGTYTIVLKASASEAGEPVSGTITGMGPFLPLSESEIDIEVEGSRPHLTQTSTWVHEDAPYETHKVPTIGVLPHSSFHTYQIRWSQKKVEFLRNGQLISTHKKVIPSQPAPFLFNHWGTNSEKWGGLATPGVDRFVFIKSFTFTPE